MKASQRGFTLIELMAASAATAVVILAGGSFMLKALSWYDELAAKVEMNRHARETFDLFAYGGVSAAVGKDGTHFVYSMRGFNKAPGRGMRSNGALQYTSNKLTLTPDLFTSMAVTCTGSGVPIPDCTAPGPGPGRGGTQTVQGWMGSDIAPSGPAQGVNNLTTEIIITVTNPFQAQRATAPGQFTDTYRTSFTLNRDEDDPH